MKIYPATAVVRLPSKRVQSRSFRRLFFLGFLAIGSATGMEAPAPSSSASPPATPATTPKKDDTPAASGTVPQIGSWLAAVAAQRAGFEVAVSVAGLCSKDAKCLLSDWDTFRAAQLRGDAEMEYIGNITQEVTELSAFIKKLDTTSCASVTNGSVADGLPSGNRTIFLKQSTTLSSTYQPLTHTNLWLGALSTGVTTFVDMVNKFAPVITLKGDAPSGLTVDDLKDNVLQTMGETDKSALLLEADTTSGTTFIHDVMGMPGAFRALQAMIASKLDEITKSQSGAVKNKKACEALKSSLSDTQSRLSTAIVQSEKIVPSDPSAIQGLILMAQDVDAASMTKAKGAPIHILDLKLGSSAINSATIKHWYGSTDQWLQAVVHARYRVILSTDGTIAQAGTFAIICQSLESIGRGVKGYSDHFPVDRDIEPKAGDPVCFSQPSLAHSKPPNKI
jgi:hypothetical protein